MLDRSPSARACPRTSILALGAAAMVGCLDTSLPAPVLDAGPEAVADAEVPTTPILTWPPDGAASVGAELQSVWFVFSARPERAIWAWRGPGGAVDFSVEGGDCGALGVEAAHCVRLVPASRLQPGAHQLGLDEGSLGAAGALQHFIGFDVLPDAPPLALTPPPCSLDERTVEDVCVLASDGALQVRFEANVPVRASLGVFEGVAPFPVLAPRGSASLRVAHLTPDTLYRLVLTLEGIDGAVRRTTLFLSTTPPLPSWTITEARVDSEGPEPAQEYVELCNFGGHPLSPSVLFITDDPNREGDRIDSPITIAPGGRVLVVPADFDEEHPEDAEVPPGLPLLRLDGPIASGGLSNSGEPLFLRDELGHRLSAMPSMPSGGPGSCIRRVSEGARTGDPGSFVVSPICTPGAPEPLETW